MAIDPQRPRLSEQTVNVVWLDVNTMLGTGLKSDLLLDVNAINNSLYNLFRCPVGARGPIFQPEYGSSIFQLLHEPLDYITANKVRMYTIQAIQRWEPRIVLDMARSRVDPDLNRNAYMVSIYYSIVATKQLGNGSYILGKS